MFVLHEGAVGTGGTPIFIPLIVTLSNHFRYFKPNCDLSPTQPIHHRQGSTRANGAGHTATKAPTQSQNWTAQIDPTLEASFSRTVPT